MALCKVIEITTPKKIILNGLWSGPQKPKQVIVWVHGLGSSVFSKIGIMENLVDTTTAVLAFNNRGHDIVARASRGVGKKKVSISAGAAHEKFEECIDDIDGAVRFAQKSGAKEIYIAGHSTGCQKAIYWAYKKGRGVKGIILLAPISDFTAAVLKQGKAKVSRTAKIAERMIKKGQSEEYIPRAVWPEETLTARRFISLYTPKSIEQSIFSYFDATRPAKMFGAVSIPMLAFFAEKDEYTDRPAKEIARWFVESARTNVWTSIIPAVTHSFHGREARVAGEIREWILGEK